MPPDDAYGPVTNPDRLAAHDAAAHLLHPLSNTDGTASKG
jgi:hypothetical protein